MLATGPFYPQRRGNRLGLLVFGALFVTVATIVTVGHQIFLNSRSSTNNVKEILSSIHRRAVSPDQAQPHRSPANGLKAFDHKISDSAENFTGEYAWEWAGTLPRMDPRPLFYNRIPKSGSEMFVLLMQWLQGYNGFKHVRLPNSHQRLINDTEQAKMAQSMKDAIELHGVPCSFDRHVYFINFTKFGVQMPIYINLVRDPVEKAISRFFYRRIGFSKEFETIQKNTTVSKEDWKRKYFEDCVRGGDPECQFIAGQPYDLAIPYFCGNEPECMILNNSWALEKAKNNLEQYYSVVGVLEDVNTTLAVFEKILPFYFSGLNHMFYTELLVPKKNRNLERPRDIAEDVKTQLRANLSMEYDLYNFAYARLRRQFDSIASTIFPDVNQ